MALPDAVDGPAVAGSCARITYHIEDLCRVRESGGVRFELHVPQLLVPAGARLGLSAPSGQGKSTLLDLLAMLLAPTEAKRFTFSLGEAVVDVLACRRDDLDELRGRRIGYMLQTGALFDFLSVRENLELPLRLLGRKDPGRVDALAVRLGIERTLPRKPAALSVGERQRAAIARALVHRPAILLADEPTASLDDENAAAVIALLLEVASEERATVIVASHSRAQLERLEVTTLEHRVERRDSLLRSEFRLAS